AGLRWLGPAWGATRYAGGTGAPGPLTAHGVELLGEMDRLGVALDVSHLAEDSFWQAMRSFKGPVASSHANCRALVPGDRHLSDEMIRAIIDRDGVVGLVLYNKFINGDWDGDKQSVTLRDLVRHVERVCELAGDTRHVALGSDFDGGFGLEGIPAELTRWGDLRLIGGALAQQGWSDRDIANLLGGSWRRWLGGVLP
ncbi:MAG TPA: membrane dipeptidase, partial [Herpetosiphonaceae bacterium]